MSSSMSKGMIPKIMADMIVKEDYFEIDTSDIELVDGWIEILNDKNEVIYVKGNKKTVSTKYKSYELADILGYHDTQQYVYSSAAFKGADGNEYVCLVALPHEKVDLQLNIINASYPLNKTFFLNLLKGITFFLILFLINIYIYSIWTAKRISVPLNKITSVINEMSRGDTSVRMEFKAENEFLEIKDAFNYMADKLQKVEEEKKKLEKDRQRMFVDISHDLKTPITTICGYAKALSEGMITEDEKKGRYLKTIYDKSIRVTNLINNLFEIAKLENTTPKFQKETGDFVEFLRGIAAEHYEQIEEKSMQLDFKINTNKSIFLFDKKELGRVISNLINNAIIYNPEGTLIRIELFDYEREVIIEVGDNGIGISEELKENIFLPFVRGDLTRSSQGGTGLGLAISKKIVEAHGGKLELRTNGGTERTIFRVTINKITPFMTVVTS